MNNLVNDPRPMLVLALDQTQAMIDTIGADELTLPTPCPEYDVRTLLGHLITVIGRIDLALTGGNPLDLPTVTTGVDDVPAAWKERRTTLDATLADDAVLDADLQIAVGNTARSRRDRRLHRRAHHPFLGSRQGHPPHRPAGRLTRRLLPAAGPTGDPAEPRGGHIPFGSVVPVADDASPYDRLAAWQGRQP